MMSFETPSSIVLRTASMTIGSPFSMIAIGPLVSYKARFGESTEIDMTFKWSHELDVKNRMKGDALVFQLSGKF